MSDRCRWIWHTHRGHPYARCPEQAIPLERVCAAHLIETVAHWDEHARLRELLAQEREAS